MDGQVVEDPLVEDCVGKGVKKDVVSEDLDAEVMLFCVGRRLICWFAGLLENLVVLMKLGAGLVVPENADGAVLWNGGRWPMFCPENLAVEVCRVLGVVGVA